MDKNKIQIYSTNGADRCDLVLFESNTIAIKVESAISNPSWPTVELEYDPRISNNSKFIQLPKYYITLNGVDCELEIINKSVTEDRGMCTFIWKDVSFAKTIKNKLWSDFVDEDGAPKYIIDVSAQNGQHNTSLFPITQEKGGKYTIMHQALVLDDRLYVRDDATVAQHTGDQFIGLSFANALWKNTGTVVMREVGGDVQLNCNGYWNNNVESGNILWTYDYVEKTYPNDDFTEDFWSIPYTLNSRKSALFQNVCQFAQFSYNNTLLNGHSPVIDTKPTDAAFNVGKPYYITWKPYTNSQFEILMPVQLLPKSIWKGARGIITSSNYTTLNPCYVTSFYVLPLVDTFNVYTKHKTTSDLPTIDVQVLANHPAEYLFDIEYTVQKDPFEYYQPGKDSMTTMYNVKGLNVYSPWSSNGYWVPVVNKNDTVSESDIISDCLHINRSTLKGGYVKLESLTEFDSTDTREDTTLKNATYSWKADDVTVNDVWRLLLDQKGFCIVKPSGEAAINLVLPWCYNANGQANSNYVSNDGNRIHGYETLWYSTDFTDGHAIGDNPQLWLKFSNITNYNDAKYTDENKKEYASVFKHQENTKFFSFAGYVDPVRNFDITENQQQIIPTKIDYHGNTYNIDSVSQLNLRTGYIAGVCYKDFAEGKYIITVNVTEGIGSFTGAGTYEDGQLVTLTAIPDQEYNLDGWYINNVKVSDSLTYTFIAYDDVTVSLKFVEKLIPSAYKQIEYIQGDGSQYIEIPMSLSNTSKVYAKFMINTAGTNGAVFNSRKSFGQNEYGIWEVAAGNQLRFDFYTTTKNVGSSYVGEIVEAQTNGNVFEIVDKFSNTFTDAEFTTPATTYLFKGATNNAKMNLYAFSVDGVCNMVPVLRVSDEIPGMYDIINKTFYSSAGTSEFIAGPDL